jgi:hypothetical protein
MDDIVEDARREVEVLLSCWQNQGHSGGIFRNHLGEASTSAASSVFYNDETDDETEDNPNVVKFVVSDQNKGPAEDWRARLLSAVSPGDGMSRGAEGDSYFSYQEAEEGKAGFDASNNGPGASGNPSREYLSMARPSTGKKLSWSDDHVATKKP